MYYAMYYATLCDVDVVYFYTMQKRNIKHIKHINILNILNKVNCIRPNTSFTRII